MRWGGLLLGVWLAAGMSGAKAEGPAKAAKAKAPGPLLAITFDDLPAHGPLPPRETRLEVAERVIRALKVERVPPTYGFVNAVTVEKSPELVNVLGTWRASGNLLGNHTWSHMNLNQHSLAEFEADIQNDEPVLNLLMYGQDWRWLRFPYLAEGNTVNKRLGVRTYLAQHGYKIADVTMSFDDYEWDEPYVRCIAKRNARAIDWMETSYLRAAEESIPYYRGMSQKLYGRDIRYVLLLHIGAFDARMLPRLLWLYREKGFTFISLAEAEQDPFYQYDVNPNLLPGPDLLEQAMAKRHLPLPKRTDYSAKLNGLCR